MLNNRLYIDIHIIQTVPPSCVNRDDTGSPKTAVYGGAVRARISSQAWKRAVREYFKGIYEAESLGLRTKKVLAMVAEEVKALNPALNAEKLAAAALDFAGVKVVKDNESDALCFMSRGQARALAALAVEGSKDKKQYKEAMKSAPSYDMALFGRMLASDPSLNFDAAAQVAHSISTHAVHNEYDYFTAVDDCADEDNAGAGHLGTLEYNSSTLYRYATVNAIELAKLLGGDAPAVIRGFCEAFILSMPDGRQNSYANRTMPDAVYIAVRRDQPVNLCGAFEEPIRSQSGYAAASVARLADYARKTYRTFADAPEAAFSAGEGLEALAEALPLSKLLEALEGCVAERLSGGDIQ